MQFALCSAVRFSYEGSQNSVLDNVIVTTWWHLISTVLHTVRRVQLSNHPIMVTGTETVPITCILVQALQPLTVSILFGIR